MEVPGELGRDGNFSLIPSLRKKYKSHRRAEACALWVRFRGYATKSKFLGKVVHARLVNPVAAGAAPGGGAMEADEEAVRRGD